MRILIILKESTMHERLGVMYLSACLKKKGFQVKVILASRFPEETLDDLLKNYSPRVVGYSLMTGEHNAMLELNKKLKGKFNFIAVFGGPHAIFYPGLIQNKGVDAVCVGEGDMAFPEFCSRVAKGEAWWETPNFKAKLIERNLESNSCSEKFFDNPLLNLIENLDSLPFPDRAVMYEADPDLRQENMRMFFTSRGCPNICSYCFNSKYNEIFRRYGKVVRFRSPENVIEEICQVKERYGLTYVNIMDDEFILKPAGWLKHFAELYVKKVGLPICCNVRAQLVTDETALLLKKMMVKSVWMGVECGDEIASNKILLRNLTNQQVIKAAKIIKRHEIKLVTQNLIGLPVPNPYETDLKTLDLNIKIQSDFAWSSILFPYPGTPIANYAKANGYILENTKFLETNKRSTIFNFSSADRRKIGNLHKLFGVIVRFPWLRRYCDFLCSLPLLAFYTAIFYVWYGYQYKVKLYRFSSIRKESVMYVKLFLRLIKKT